MNFDGISENFNKWQIFIFHWTHSKSFILLQLFFLLPPWCKHHVNILFQTESSGHSLWQRWFLILKYFSCSNTFFSRCLWISVGFCLKNEISSNYLAKFASNKEIKFVVTKTIIVNLFLYLKITFCSLVLFFPPLVSVFFVEYCLRANLCANLCKYVEICEQMWIQKSDFFPFIFYHFSLFKMASLSPQPFGDHLESDLGRNGGEGGYLGPYIVSTSRHSSIFVSFKSLGRSAPPFEFFSEMWVHFPEISAEIFPWKISRKFPEIYFREWFPFFHIPLKGFLIHVWDIFFRWWLQKSQCK